jgi:hypothetical protein
MDYEATKRVLAALEPERNTVRLKDKADAELLRERFRLEDER